MRGCRCKSGFRGGKSPALPFLPCSILPILLLSTLRSTVHRSSHEIRILPAFIHRQRSVTHDFPCGTGHLGAAANGPAGGADDVRAGWRSLGHRHVRHRNRLRCRVCFGGEWLLRRNAQNCGESDLVCAAFVELCRTGEQPQFVVSSHGGRNPRLGLRLERQAIQNHEQRRQLGRSQERCNRIKHLLRYLL